MRTRLKEEISDELHTLDTKRIRADEIALNNEGFLDGNKRLFEIQFNKCKRFGTLIASRLLRVVSLLERFIFNKQIYTVYRRHNEEIQKKNLCSLTWIH